MRGIRNLSSISVLQWTLFIFTYLWPWFSLLHPVSNLWIVFFFFFIWLQGTVGIEYCSISPGFSLNYFCNVFIALFEVSSSCMTFMIECLHFMKIKNGWQAVFIILYVWFKKWCYCFGTSDSERISLCLLCGWIILLLATPATLQNSSGLAVLAG